MELIYREIKKAIEEATPYYPVITITGPRQSGKTTLCQNLFPDLPYINLEDVDVRADIEKDTRKYLEHYPTGLIIDEAHHYPDLFSYIMVAVDKNPRLRYVLTGSSNFSLLEKITQSLAGRTAVFTLLPFSFREIKADENNLSPDTLIFNGGYPAVWAKNIPQNMFFANYNTTYIERDLHKLINVRDMRAFQTFIGLTAGRIGTEYNAAALSNEIGVAYNTIKHWISILSASYIAYILPPYYENISKRLIKSPKIYFYDTGLACYLLGIENEQQLERHPLRGALFENMVINEAHKQIFNRGKRANLFFYRDRSQHEVDLIQTKAQNLELFEIKSAKTFHHEFFKNIHYLKKLFGYRIERSTLIYDGSMETPTNDDGIINFRRSEI